MSSFVEEVAARLTARAIPYELDGATLTVRPRDTRGFTASLQCRDGANVVSFDGWHETFEDARAAASCFVFGLTTRARLRVTRRWGKAWAWALEALEDGVWQEDSETGVLRQPWWAKKSFEYLQNDWTTIE